MVASISSGGVEEAAPTDASGSGDVLGAMTGTLPSGWAVVIVSRVIGPVSATGAGLGGFARTPEVFLEQAHFVVLTDWPTPIPCR